MNIIKIKSENLKLKKNENISNEKYEDILDKIYCKKNNERYGGGGYHPLRAMNYLIKLNDFELKENIHKINESYKIDRNDYFLYPYNFDFALHSNKNNVMKSNWFSGMAQGFALIAYCRYGKKDITDKIFNSFKSSEILQITDSGYHYMEYPNKCDALNGHIFALYGLYEYWHIYQTDESKFLLEKGIEWVKNNLHHYRNEGGASFYCQNHKVLCDKVGGKYHKVHIEQLRYIYEITGDIWFEEQANLFLSDFNVE